MIINQKNDGHFTPTIENQLLELELRISISKV